jgi:hypothetical protein
MTYHAYGIAAIFALFVIGSISRAEANTVLSDSSFSSGWSGAYLNGTSNGTVTFTNPSSGGDPGSYGEMTLTASRGGVGLGIFSPDMAYNAAIQGAMTSITFSFDYKRISGTDVPVQLITLLTNDGYSYPETLAIGNATTWTPFSETFAVPSNALLNTHPVEFGFGNYGNVAGPITSSVGFDNFVVTITTPEPSTWAMMLGATALLVLTGRLRLIGTRNGRG